MSADLLYGDLIQEVGLRSDSMDISAIGRVTNLGSWRKATVAPPRCFERITEETTPPSWLAVMHGIPQKTMAHALRLAHSLLMASAPNVHKAPDKR